MTRICSFPPQSSKNANTLILGSMPGEASLKANQYYAHPRNLFWKIVLQVLDDGTDRSYAARLKVLKENKIALWDVIDHCIRPGSLDSSIREEIPNDFAGFLKSHPHITRIFFNGQKAAKSFRRYVLRDLDLKDRAIEFVTLPSTSPANASQSMDKKLSAWVQIKPD